MATKERKDFRVSVSLSPRVHAEVMELADKSDVSVAWVVRYAVTELVERYRENPQQKLPLSFRRSASET